MINKWENIINILACMKPKCIDRESIKAELDTDRTFDHKTLDHLYMMRIIEHEEYLKYLHKLIEHKEEDISFINFIIE